MTVAIYEKLPEGMYRIGTFTARKATSIREVCRQFYVMHPRHDGAGLYLCQRMRLFGKWADWGDLIPFEPRQSQEVAQ